MWPLHEARRTCGIPNTPQGRLLLYVAVCRPVGPAKAPSSSDNKSIGGSTFWWHQATITCVGARHQMGRLDGYAWCCAAEASNMCVSPCDSGIGQCMLVDTSVQSGVRRALAVACKAPGSSHPLLLQSSGAVSVACWGPCVCCRHVRGLKQQQRRQWPLVTTVSNKESFFSGL